MNNVTEIDSWLSKKADENSAPLRDHLFGFAKRIADLSFQPGVSEPLGLQCLCAGWQGYLDMPQTTRWWWPVMVPVFHGPGPCGKGVRVDFLNGRAPRPDDEPAPTICSIAIFAKVRNEPVTDENYLTILDNVIKNLPDEGAGNPTLAPMCVLFFARKDMGFKYHSHSVENNVITMTVDALTERMVMTFDANHCITLLQQLNEQVERLNRRGAKTEDPDIPPMDLPE